MAIATCGHYVDEGITYSIRDHTREGEETTSYGTYCSECFLNHHREGVILNLELTEVVTKFIERIEKEKSIGNSYRGHKDLLNQYRRRVAELESEMDNPFEKFDGTIRAYEDFTNSLIMILGNSQSGDRAKLISVRNSIESCKEKLGIEERIVLKSPGNKEVNCGI